MSGPIGLDNGNGVKRAMSEKYLKPTVSIVVPVYGCAATLEQLFQNTRDILTGFLGETMVVEWLFIDDQSQDGAWPIIRKLCSQDAMVRGIRLSNNYGQHKAIMVGLSKARGEWTVVMDCDLEDPPVEIPRLLQSIGKGKDIIIASYQYRQQSFYRRAGSEFYRWLLNMPGVAGYRLGTFSVLSRRARSAYLNSSRAGCAYLLVLLQLGLPFEVIESYKNSRSVGSSSYTFLKLLGTAVQCLFLFRPRRFVAGLGLLTALILGLTIGIHGWNGVGLFWLIVLALVVSSLFFITHKALGGDFGLQDICIEEILENPR